MTNCDNGTIGANEANDDPFETMMIHWSYNGYNGSNGDYDFNDDIGFNVDNGNNNSNGDGGNIGANNRKRL